MDYSLISTSSIDLSDKLFFLRSKVSPSLNWNDIAEIVNPIWVQEIDKDRYRLVDGFRILNLQLANCGPGKIAAKIMEKDTSAIEIWKLRVLRRFQEQNISIIGVLESLVTVLAFSDQSSLPKDIVTFLRSKGFGKLSLKFKDIKHHVKLVQASKDFACVDELGFTEILSISKLTEDKIELLKTMFKGMELKGNKLTSLLLIIEELEKGFELELKDILKQQKIAEIINSVPPHLRYKRLKQTLYSLRWPTLSKTQSDWDKLISSFDLHGSIDIQMDPYFEDDAIKFSFVSPSKKEFDNKLKALNNAANQEDFARIFDFL